MCSEIMQEKSLTIFFGDEVLKNYYKSLDFAPAFLEKLSLHPKIALCKDT
jgi:hypothetical protein